jgi:serine/threonine-protein kinase
MQGAYDCPWAPGDVLAGRYQLTSIIGEGAMGWVFRAHDQTLDVDVAVKLLHRGASDEGDAAAQQAAERLAVEAKAVARLENPGIVRVLDFGEAPDGLPFFVMELLQGETLADAYERRGKMPEVSAVQLFIPVADALAMAHARGVVHRDLKPENILIVPLDDEGSRQPKVVDFGVARLVGQGSRRLTAVGGLIGTPGYMAPEQARALPDVDGRADVFSLAVMLYLMTTGELPFEGENVAQYLTTLLTSEPRSTVDFGGDAELWAILKRGLARDREARWRSMAEFRDALVGWALSRGAQVDATGTLLELRSRPSRRTSQPAPPAQPAPTATSAEITPARPSRWRRALVVAALFSLAAVVAAGVFIAVVAFARR